VWEFCKSDFAGTGRSFASSDIAGCTLMGLQGKASYQVYTGMLDFVQAPANTKQGKNDIETRRDPVQSF
jgi:hypothetical protein